jgi:hypothetical protein
MVNQNKVILKTIQIFVFLGLCNSSYYKIQSNPDLRDSDLRETRI